MSVSQYDGARDALQVAVYQFLQTATELRNQGEALVPSPEVVGIEHAMEIIRWWTKAGDKSSEDRFRRRLYGQLDDLSQIAKARFGSVT